ncbi:MAG: TolC family protein [Pirellulaceae bacterium]
MGWNRGRSVMLLLLAAIGCASSRDDLRQDALLTPAHATLNPYAAADGPADREPTPDASPSPVRPVSFQSEEAVNKPEPLPPIEPEPVEEPPFQNAGPLELTDVVASVYRSHPMIESAVLSRVVAAGEQFSAQGAFDLKLKGASENQPLGFYETYRQSAGFEQPLLGGANVFGGYRIGRGNFEPWYLERQTNGSGEFKAGVLVPLLQNRGIDDRRAELWRSGWARREVEPLIRSEFIAFVQAASVAYWEWVAAGQAYRVADDLLALAVERAAGLKRRVEAGDLPQIELTDNERLIVSREAKQIDARRKLEQSAIKLSLFFRDAQGRPVVPPGNLLPPVFPEARNYARAQVLADIQQAQQNRPELAALEFVRRQIEVDLAQAENQLLPQLNAAVAASQDIGTPTSSKNDKGPLELQGGVFVDVPLQRRKARGKIQALEAKRGQVLAKQRFASDKITTDVQNAAAAVAAAYERIGKTRRSVELARTMAEAERRKFDLGDSDLFLVNQREQQQADAELLLVEALLEYFQARAAYRAALGIDRVEDDAAPTR